MSRFIAIPLADHASDQEIGELLEELGRLQLSHEPRLVEDVDLDTIDPIGAALIVLDRGAHDQRDDELADVREHSLRVGGEAALVARDRARAPRSCSCGGRGICTVCVLRELARPVRFHDGPRA